MDTIITPETIGLMPQKQSDWNTWLENGDKYISAATPKKSKSRFSNEILYNLLSLALESYSMAILDYHNQLPENHTYTDLVVALEEIHPLKVSVKKRILRYENIQSICSVEKYHRTAPSKDELADLKGAILEIGDLAHQTCT